MRTLISIIMLILFCRTAYGDIYTDCSYGYTKISENALDNREWSDLVSINRKKMSVCGSLLDNKDKASTLSSMLIGMNELGRYKDAIPVANRCIKYDDNNSGCYAALGRAYYETKEYSKSLSVFKALISLGAYDEFSASTVNYAKAYISKIAVITGDGSANVGVSSKSFGSGVFINNNGYIATASHVVRGCSEITINHNNKEYPAKIIVSDTQNDLAVLKVGFDSPSFSLIRDNKTVKVGEDVVAVGYPLSGILAAQVNVTKGNISSLAGLGDDTRYYQITAPVQQGNSGGPLFDVNGNLIGIITSKLDALRTASLTGDIPQNVNFAVKSYILTNILDTKNIQYKIVTNSKNATGDKVEQMTSRTVFISCNP